MTAHAQIATTFVGGGEIIVVIIVAIVLFMSRSISDFASGLRKALQNFRKEVDQSGFEAGQSLGGIYGKPAFEAMTTDNQNVELYDPAVSHNNGQIVKGAGTERREMKRSRMANIMFGVAVGLLLLSIVLLLSFAFSAANH